VEEHHSMKCPVYGDRHGEQPARFGGVSQMVSSSQMTQLTTHLWL